MAVARHLTTRQLSDLLGGEDAGVSVRTLEDWRHDGRGPAYIRSESKGRKATILYPESEVEKWLTSRLVRPGAP